MGFVDGWFAERLGFLVVTLVECWLVWSGYWCFSCGVG